MTKNCRPITLVQNSMTRVTRCPECGCIAVDIGALTFRVNDEALEQLRDTLTEASTKLMVQRSGRQWMSSEPGEFQ